MYFKLVACEKLFFIAPQFSILPVLYSLSDVDLDLAFILILSLGWECPLQNILALSSMAQGMCSPFVRIWVPLTSLFDLSCLLGVKSLVFVSSTCAVRPFNSPLMNVTEDEPYPKSFCNHFSEAKVFRVHCLLR